MAFCDNCGAKFYELPFHCRRCNEDFCSKCRLPEDHDCSGLVKHNVFENLSHGKKKKHYYEVQEEYKREYVGAIPKQKKNVIERVKHYIKSKYYKFKYWLNIRHHRAYSNWNAFLMNTLWIFILSISFLILYSNVTKLNKIVLWFLPLGGVLLIVNGIFWIKYTYKLLKRGYYWFEGERNWVKYIVIFTLLLILWQSYEQRNTIFNPLIDFYDKTNFSAILPIGISQDIPEQSPFSSKSVNTIKESVKEKVTEVVNPEPISEKTMQVEQAILKYTNMERKSRELNELRWDANLAEVARDHSLDMVNNNFFSHDNLQGEDPTARALRHNYNVHKELGGGWYSDGIAENIGKIPTGNVEGMGYIYSDADSIGKAQVESWMQSSGHRQNILDQQYVRLGVGVAYDGTYYVATQNFY